MISRESTDGRQLLGSLLENATEPGQPASAEQVLEKVLTALGPAKLEELLGGKLTGEPVKESTVEELAKAEGLPTGQLVEQFDTTTPKTLEGGAMALTAPLTNGKTLSVLDDTVEGVDLGTLTHDIPGSGGPGGTGAGGAGGSSGTAAGGPGGSGGSAGSPAAGNTTIINELPSPGSPSATAAAKAAGKVKVISHRVKGDALTLVVQVPAAGKLSVVGRGVHSQSKQADQAERLTVKSTLTKASVASLRRHHRRLQVKLLISFKIAGGAGSTASTSVVFG